MQLEEALTVNRAVDGSSPSCVKQTKSLQQAFNHGLFWSKPKHGGPVYHNNIMSKFKNHLYPLHSGQVLRLPGAGNLI